MKDWRGRAVGWALLAVLVYLLGVAGFIAQFDAELPASKRADAAIVLGAYTRFTGGWIWLQFLARETYLYAGSLLWTRPQCEQSELKHRGSR